MSTPFLGEIRPFSFSFAPRGWAQCNGQLLQIIQNQALFAVIGTTFGGDGVRTFALPDLRDRVPIHTSNSLPYGSHGGEPTVTLNAAQMPSHSHALRGSTAPADLQTGTLSVPGGRRPVVPYGAASSVTPLRADAVQLTGGQAHENMQPFLTINFCIALQGLFPTRN